MSTMLKNYLSSISFRHGHFYKWRFVSSRHWKVIKRSHRLTSFKTYSEMKLLKIRCICVTTETVFSVVHMCLRYSFAIIVFILLRVRLLVRTASDKSTATYRRYMWTSFCAYFKYDYRKLCNAKGKILFFLCLYVCWLSPYYRMLTWLEIIKFNAVNSSILNLRKHRNYDLAVKTPHDTRVRDKGEITLF